MASEGIKRQIDRLLAEAMEHSDFAIGGFHYMKMQPYLEMALRHR